MTTKMLKQNFEDLKKLVGSYQNQSLCRELWNDIQFALLDRIKLNNTPAVAVFDICDKVVSPRAAKYCEYSDEYYFGRIIVGEDGSFFNSLAEAKAKYGDDMKVVLGSHNGSYLGSTRRQECYYVEDLDCAVILDIDWQITRDLTIKRRNPVISRVITSDGFYICGYYHKGYLVHQAQPEDRVEGLIEVAQRLFNIPCGIVNVSANHYIVLDNLENVRKFLVSKNKCEYKNTKAQRKIDELVARTAPCELNVSRMPHEYKELTCSAHVNKIDDGLCVIRWTYNYRDFAFDGMRIYLDGKDTYACKRNNNGQFIHMKWNTLSKKNFESEYTEMSMDDMTGTRLEWYASLINEIPEKHRIPVMLLFISDPKIEQIAKLGFCKSICNCIDRNIADIGAHVRTALRVNADEDTGKNIYRWLGLNKYQLACILDVCEHVDGGRMKDGQFDVVNSIKNVFQQDNIADYDNKTFDGILYAYEALLCNRVKWNYATIEDIAALVQNTNIDETGVFKSNMLRYIQTLFEICDGQEDRNGIREYKDFINMVCTMNIHQQVKLYPATRADIKMMHDNVTQIYNLRKNEYRKSAFITRAKTVEKLAYEDDKFEFIVRTPEKPEDLAVEGLELHHCVKSYIGKVADGQTNIVFIRKKSEPDKPFFTVEVGNDNTIHQVHGFSNRNAASEPNMVTFVQRWAKAKKLKLGYYNGVR